MSNAASDVWLLTGKKKESVVFFLGGEVFRHFPSTLTIQDAPRDRRLKFTIEWV